MCFLVFRDRSGGFRLVFLKCFCKLVRAGGAFAGAVDTLHAGNCLIDVIASDQGRDALCVAGAAADEADFLYLVLRIKRTTEIPVLSSFTLRRGRSPPCLRGGVSGQSRGCCWSQEHSFRQGAGIRRPSGRCRVPGARWACE